MTRKERERPSAEERRKFSMIWGEKTTTQQAMEMEPQIPLRASMSIEDPLDGDMMSLVELRNAKREEKMGGSSCDFIFPTIRHLTQGQTAPQITVAKALS